MKKRIGKISIVALLILVSILMVLNLLMQATTARTIKTVFIPQTGNVELHGDVWYVDGNRPNDGGAGTSWADAFQKLSTAMAVSHADIARTADRQWAGRNTIYVKGDSITEDFTKMAQKTDIIGVGSNSGYDKAGITGTWIIPDTVSYMGCHFYNLMFTDPGANPIFDIDSQGGLEFHNCLFNASGSTTIGLQIEESSWLIVENCEFSAVAAGNPEFTTAAIKIVNDTDRIHGYRIVNNYIETLGIGIDCDESDLQNCWVVGNYIYSQGLTIDDDGDALKCVDNKLITTINVDSHAENTGWDFNPNLAVNNEIIGGTSEVSNNIPIIEESDAG